MVSTKTVFNKEFPASCFEAIRTVSYSIPLVSAWIRFSTNRRALVELYPMLRESESCITKLFETYRRHNGLISERSNYRLCFGCCVSHQVYPIMPTDAV